MTVDRSTVSVKDGNLCIDLPGFVESLDDDCKHAVAKACAFDEDLIRMVVEMVGTGTAFSEDGLYGWSFGFETINRIREGLLPLMDDVVQMLVAHILRQHEQDHLETMRWQEAYWKLWHHHNDDRDRECGHLAPELPKFLQPSWPTTADVQRVIEEAREKWGSR